MAPGSAVALAQPPKRYVVGGHESCRKPPFMARTLPSHMEYRQSASTQRIDFLVAKELAGSCSCNQNTHTVYKRARREIDPHQYCTSYTQSETTKSHVMLHHTARPQTKWLPDCAHPTASVPSPQLLWKRRMILLFITRTSRLVNLPNCGTRSFKAISSTGLLSSPT